MSNNGNGNSPEPIMGNKNCLGRARSAETRAKIGAKMLGNTNGRHRTPENREKLRVAFSGENNPNWNGGKTVAHGYVSILRPNHPCANVYGYVLEHRLVMEACLGRTLLPTEVVHHGPGGPGDNRIGNLVLCQNQASHRAIHGGEIYLPW